MGSIIAIDMRSIATNYRGFRRLLNWIAALGTVDTKHPYWLLADNFSEIRKLNLPPNFESVSARRFRAMRRWWGSIILKPLWYKAAVCHFPTGDIWYSPPCPTIVTIHDLAPYHFPERFFSNSRVRAKYFSHLEQVRRLADLVITVSEFSRQDLINVAGFRPEQVRVVFQGCEHLRRDFSPSLEEVRATKQKFGLAGDYIYFCGGLDFRKNLLNLVRAHEVLVRKHNRREKLVIAGGKGEILGRGKDYYPDLEAEIARLNMHQHIIMTGWVKDRELAALYAGAKVFVYPSLIEGFGYPVLEAMWYGVPVVVTKLTALPETVGQAGVLVAPEPDDIAEGILSVLEDDQLSQKLRTAGFLQVQKFTWHKMAKDTLAIYREWLREE